VIAPPATTAILRVWMKERHGLRDEPAFPTRTGRRLSDDAVEARLAIHKSVARQRCPSLSGKALTPHTLRHTCERCYAAASTSRSSPFGSATRPIGIAHRGLVSRSDTALPVPLVGRVTVDSPSRNQPLRDVRSRCFRTVSAPLNVRRIRNLRAYGWVELSRTHNCQVRGARVGSGPKLSR
jgi:hypothetical protein